VVGKTGIIHVWAISKPDVGSVGMVVSRLGLKWPNITSAGIIVSPLGGISTLAFNISFHWAVLSLWGFTIYGWISQGWLLILT